eukprot:2551196-Karenia_brevis.AAC.1
MALEQKKKGGSPANMKGKSGKRKESHNKPDTNPNTYLPSSTNWSEWKDSSYQNWQNDQTANSGQ